MDDRVIILHLSDLHLGSGELRAEVAKAKIPDAERRRIVDRLGGYLRALPRRPDIVCVTGDIANRGDASGFSAFLSWVRPLIEDGALPPRERFLVTPGNHDVKRHAVNATDRFAGFGEVAGAFPHAYIPGHDPPTIAMGFESGAGLAGGMKTAEEFGKIKLISSQPFLYDAASRVLVFAFNSSLACGIYSGESEWLLREIDKAREMAAGDSALARQLETLRTRAAEDLLVDAGLVGDEQIAYFEEMMKVIRAHLGSTWDQVAKVAILHHHLNPIWRQQLELKPFESIIDAAQVKQALTEFGFDIVLHGHKHQNGVSLDATVVPTTEGRSPDPISIVSGGTVCGYPALNDHQTFKTLILDRTSRRESAVVEEYPLRDSADPAASMRTERSVYRLPLADRIPELHDDASLKRLVDGLLVDEAIAGEPAPLTRTDGGLTTLKGDSDLVAEHARYRFASMLDAGGRRTFLDVFVATSRLDFRQRARIHWMLVDVKHLAAASLTRPQIWLVIGNLGDTHFSRERIHGEISASIEDLRAAFAPAIQLGLLRIVERRLTQNEMDGLDHSIPATSRKSQ